MAAVRNNGEPAMICPAAGASVNVVRPSAVVTATLVLWLSRCLPLHAFHYCIQTSTPTVEVRRCLQSSPLHRQHRLVLQATAVDKEPSSILHTVNGVNCVEVKTSLPLVGEITILEATADSQDLLVNLALEDEDDDGNDATTTPTTTTSSVGLAHGDPYGAVLWPAASTVAYTLLSDPSKWLHGQTVLELGAGTGLVSLAAAAGGASKVIATDYESIPLQLLEYAQEHLNPQQHPIARVETQLLDLCRYENAPLPPADLVVATDVMYEPKTGRALARRVAEALSSSSGGGARRVLIGDSPGRSGRPAFLRELHKLLPPGSLLRRQANFVDVPGWTVTGERHDLICGAASKSVSKEPRQLMVALMELDGRHLNT